MTETKEIYLDNAATTRPWPEVIETVNRAMAEGFGNASSNHRRGLSAAREVLRAEAAIVDVVGGGPWKVIFTSGGTESDGLAILGSAPKAKRTKLVATDLEHAAVTETGQALAARGGVFEEVTGGLSGRVSPEAVLSRVDERTAMVSVTYAAGELGTVQPVADIARAVKRVEPKCRVHTDAVQALPQLGVLDLCPEVDMVTVSAHKIHGPQGVGALLCRPGALPRPQLFGGDQQQSVRPGTLNLPGIAGFGEAARLFAERRGAGIPKMRALCDRLTEGITGSVEGAHLLGDPSVRAPGIAVIAFDRIKSEVLLHILEMRGVIASASSACHSSRRAPPRSLVNAGLRGDQGAVRFSLTLDTTKEEIDGAIAAVSQAVLAFRQGRIGDL